MFLTLPWDFAMPFSVYGVLGSLFAFLFLVLVVKLAYITYDHVLAKLKYLKDH